MNDETPDPRLKTPEDRKSALLVLWAAMTSTIGLYTVMALILSQSRSGLVGANVAPDYLRGSLQYLAFLLPMVLFFLGTYLFDLIRRGSFKPSDTPPAGLRDPADWRQIATAFVVMLAIFEVNILVGVLFFFLGSSFARFTEFVLTSAILMIVALRRLLELPTK